MERLTIKEKKEAQEMKELLIKIKNQVAKEYRMKNFLVLIGSIHPSRMESIVNEVSRRYGAALVKRRSEKLFERNKNVVYTINADGKEVEGVK